VSPCRCPEIFFLIPSTVPISVFAANFLRALGCRVSFFLGVSATGPRRAAPCGFRPARSIGCCVAPSLTGPAVPSPSRRAACLHQTSMSRSAADAPKRARRRLPHARPRSRGSGRGRPSGVRPQPEPDRGSAVSLPAAPQKFICAQRRPFISIGSPVLQSRLQAVLAGAPSQPNRLRAELPPDTSTTA